jgi:hypothetical protein
MADSEPLAAQIGKWMSSPQEGRKMDIFLYNERLFIKMSEIPKEVPFSPKPEMQNPPEKKAELAPQPMPPEVIHPDTVAVHSEKRVIDLRTVSFEVDPMVAHKIQMQMQDNPRFAQTIHTNITKLFYDYIIYKVRMRENLNLAIKGETRSGKSTVGLSFGHFISSLTRVPYGAYHICANESEYYSKVKNAKFSELYHIDEQKESKFGSGSFREEMSIMDIQNIIAKQCLKHDTEILAWNTATRLFEPRSLLYLSAVKNFSVLSLNLITKQMERKPALISYSGRKLLIKLTTSAGQTIEADPEHKLILLSDNKFIKKMVKDIKICDKIVCRK